MTDILKSLLKDFTAIYFSWIGLRFRKMWQEMLLDFISHKFNLAMRSALAVKGCCYGEVVGAPTFPTNCLKAASV